MISHKGVGEGSHSYQDTRSEVGVTSVGCEVVGAGGAEGAPAGAGGEASDGWWVLDVRCWWCVKHPKL